MNPALPRPLAAMIDLDGTLVDTLGDFDAALNGMLRELNLPPLAAADVMPMVGKGVQHLVLRTLLHVAPQDGPARAQARFDAALAAYERHYHAVNGRHSRVYDGVQPGLQALQQRGLRLACLTNKPVGFARALLAQKGLDGFFEHVFGGDSFERKKPDPLPLLRTAEALGVAPAQALMVGDSANDAQAARAAGCPVVLLTYGYNHGEPIHAVDADAHLDSMADVADWLGGA
jgi:phosphoglycolate phosphatase